MADTPAQLIGALVKIDTPPPRSIWIGFLTPCRYATWTAESRQPLTLKELHEECKRLEVRVISHEKGTNLDTIEQSIKTGGLRVQLHFAPSNSESSPEAPDTALVDTLSGSESTQACTWSDG